MFFIINQNAKLNKADLIFKNKIKPLLKKRRVCFDFITTKTFGETIFQTKKAVKKHKTIVACGGDGTINAVAQGILNTKAVMGVLPLGSANNFAFQSLNIPINLKKALKVLLARKIIKIDIGKINKAIFLNVVGVGISGQVAFLGHKHWFYRFLPSLELRYGLPLLEKLCLFKPFDLTLKVNFKLVFQGKSILTTICNGKGDGKYFAYNYKASLQDNNLKIMIVEDIPPLERIDLLSKILINKISKIKNVKKVHFFQGSQIHFNFKKNTQTPFPFFQIDGEPIELGRNHFYHNIFLTNKDANKTNIFDIKVLPQILPVIVGDNKTACDFKK